METTEIVKTETTEVGLGNKIYFEHIQRVANMFCKSDIVPKRYRDNIGNCIIALNIAHRLKADELMVMQNLDIIQGKPGWSSQFLIASLNASGKFSPLRYEEDEADGGRTRAWANDKLNNQKLEGPWVSMQMAKAEGWIEKAGSKWKTMPEVMRRYRAASFFVKQFAPEISMGLQTSEEVIDITPLQEATVITKEDERAFDLINNCKTVEEVADLEKTLPEKYKEQAATRKRVIRDEKISQVAHTA